MVIWYPLWVVDIGWRVFVYTVAVLVSSVTDALAQGLISLLRSALSEAFPKFVFQTVSRSLSGLLVKEGDGIAHFLSG